MNGLARALFFGKCSELESVAYKINYKERVH